MSEIGSNVTPSGPAPVLPSSPAAGGVTPSTLPRSIWASSRLEPTSYSQTLLLSGSFTTATRPVREMPMRYGVPNPVSVATLSPRSVSMMVTVLALLLPTQTRIPPGVVAVQRDGRPAAVGRDRRLVRPVPNGKGRDGLHRCRIYHRGAGALLVRDDDHTRPRGRVGA